MSCVWLNGCRRSNNLEHFVTIAARRSVPSRVCRSNRRPPYAAPAAPRWAAPRWWPRSRWWPVVGQRPDHRRGLAAAEQPGHGGGPRSRRRHRRLGSRRPGERPGNAGRGRERDPGPAGRGRADPRPGRVPRRPRPGRRRLCGPSRARSSPGLAKVRFSPVRLPRAAAPQLRPRPAAGRSTASPSTSRGSSPRTSWPGYDTGPVVEAQAVTFAPQRQVVVRVRPRRRQPAPRRRATPSPGTTARSASPRAGARLVIGQASDQQSTLRQGRGGRRPGRRRRPPVLAGRQRAISGGTAGSWSTCRRRSGSSPASSRAPSRPRTALWQWPSRSTTTSTSSQGGRAVRQDQRLPDHHQPEVLQAGLVVLRGHPAARDLARRGRADHGRRHADAGWSRGWPSTSAGARATRRAPSSCAASTRRTAKAINARTFHLHLPASADVLLGQLGRHLAALHDGLPGLRLHPAPLRRGQAEGVRRRMGAATTSTQGEARSSGPRCTRPSASARAQLESAASQLAAAVPDQALTASAGQPASRRRRAAGSAAR